MIANVLIALVAGLEFLFLVLEMFLWRTERVRRSFGFSKQFADESAVLAKNQGLYNGFLSAGLVWGIVIDNFQIKFFFLACVLIAGICGALTANKRILFIQALPAFVALLALMI